MLDQRFFSKIEVHPISGCWEWVAAKNKQGYGNYFHDGKVQLAHRVIYSDFHNAKLTPEIKICHGCDNPSCVHPRHLFSGTQQDNMDDMYRKGRGRKKGLKGQKNPMSRLTREQVIDILRSAKTGEELAAEYGVANTTISAIKRGVNWKHVYAEVTGDK